MGGGGSRGRARALWAGRGGAALPGAARASNFRLPAAASGPPFLGNNGAENGRLSGQEAARRRRSGTARAERGQPAPSPQRRGAAAHTQPARAAEGRRRRAVSSGAGAGSQNGPGKGEAQAWGRRRRRRPPLGTAPKPLSSRSGTARWGSGGSIRGAVRERGAVMAVRARVCPDGPRSVTPGDSPGGASLLDPDPPSGAGAGFVLPPGRAGGPCSLQVSGWAGGGF